MSNAIILTDLPSLPLVERRGLPDTAAISCGATASWRTTRVPLSLGLSRWTV